MDRKAPLTCLILATCACPALAQESSSLSLRPGLAVKSGMVAPWRAVDALAPKPAVLIPPASGAHDPVPGTCALSTDALCYDHRSGSLVYKPLRALMPEIGGLQRESIAIKRDKVTFRYSFR
jgi:hypothetical protein